MLTIPTTPEIDAALTERARRQNTTPELLVLEMVRERVLPSPTFSNETLDATLAGLLAEANALEIAAPRPGLTDEYGQILAEKFRRQGLEI